MKPFLEVLPGDLLSIRNHSLGSFPPCTSWSSKEMGCKGNLIPIVHTGNQQVVFNGAEPVVRIKGLNALGENRWVGVLKIPQLGAGSFIIVVIVVVVVVVVFVDGRLGNLL